MKKQLYSIIVIIIMIATVSGNAKSAPISNETRDILNFKDKFLSKIKITDNSLTMDIRGLKEDFSLIAKLAKSNLGESDLLAQYSDALDRLILLKNINVVSATLDDSVEASTSFHIFLRTMTQNLSDVGNDPDEIFRTLSGEFRNSIAEDLIVRGIQEMLIADNILNSIDARITDEVLGISINKQLFYKFREMLNEHPEKHSAPIPEPTTFMLVGLGLGITGLWMSRKQNIT